MHLEWVGRRYFDVQLFFSELLCPSAQVLSMLLKSGSVSIDDLFITAM